MQCFTLSPRYNVNNYTQNDIEIFETIEPHLKPVTLEAEMLESFLWAARSPTLTINEIRLLHRRLKFNLVSTEINLNKKGATKSKQKLLKL